MKPKRNSYETCQIITKEKTNYSKRNQKRGKIKEQSIIKGSVKKIQNE